MPFTIDEPHDGTAIKPGSRALNLSFSIVNFDVVPSTASEGFSAVLEDPTNSINVLVSSTVFVGVGSDTQDLVALGLRVGDPVETVGDLIGLCVGLRVGSCMSEKK